MKNTKARIEELKTMDKNKYFVVDEHNSDLLVQLKKYLSENELQIIENKSNKAAYILSLQSEHLKKLIVLGLIEDFRHMELEKIIVEFYNQQELLRGSKGFHTLVILLALMLGLLRFSLF